MNTIKKQMSKFWDNNYTIMLKPDGAGVFIARVMELYGCVARGNTAREALKNLDGVKRLWIDSCYKDGDWLPNPYNKEGLPSGRWIQRVPQSLHKEIIKKAASEGVSVNQLVMRYVTESLGVA